MRKHVHHPSYCYSSSVLFPELVKPLELSRPTYETSMRHTGDHTIATAFPPLVFLAWRTTAAQLYSTSQHILPACNAQGTINNKLQRYLCAIRKRLEAASSMYDCPRYVPTNQPTNKEAGSLVLSVQVKVSPPCSLPHTVSHW